MHGPARWSTDQRGEGAGGSVRDEGVDAGHRQEVVQELSLAGSIQLCLWTEVVIIHRS